MRTRFGVAAIALLLSACAPSSAGAPRSAPGFALPSLDGRTVTLREFRGRPVVLNFWATWCAPCRIETPWLVALEAKYRAKGVQFLGISLDDAGARGDVRNFAAKFGVVYPVLLGNPSVADAYGGVRMMPQTFFIGADGTIASSTIGVTSAADFEAAVRRLLPAGGS